MFIAARTTALARLKLLKALEIVESYREQGGAKPLYCDTDSIVLKVLRSLKAELFDKLQVGDEMGKLKNEMPEHEIEEYICGGSKAYALKVKFKMIDFYKFRCATRKLAKSPTIWRLGE